MVVEGVVGLQLTKGIVVLIADSSLADILASTD